MLATYNITIKEIKDMKNNETKTYTLELQAKLDGGFEEMTFSVTATSFFDAVNKATQHYKKLGYTVDEDSFQELD